MLPRRGRARRPGRSTPPSSPPPPAATPAPTIVEIACLCGHLLRVAREATNYLCTCPGCKRRFFISLTREARSGSEIAVPVYVTDRSGPHPPPPHEEASVDNSTRIAEAVGKDEALLSSTDELRLLSDKDPEPPSAMYFICKCGQKLIARKDMYDKRIRCPYCNERQLLTLVYDPGAKNFDIKPMSLSGPPQGDTWTLDKT